ncbi:MAG: hypothetical protein M1480_12495 [Bacteroidetes bacterium]|nr:hypothetical protein [Bacteroidota bacterium]
MIQLSDEVLNKYIDGELEGSVLREIQKQLKNSELDRRRLAILQTVHRELANLKLYQVSDDFTSSIMLKVRKNLKVVRKDRYFILSVFSIFVIISLIIISYLIDWTATQDSGINSVAQNINNYVDYIVNTISPIKDFLTAKNMSIIGFIFSFGIIVGGYLFLESIKQSKRNLSKLH